MQEEKHSSYGMMQFTRVSCSGKGTPLFGSSILHNDYVEMRLYGATIKRDLNRDWFHQGREVVCVEMSAVQFAESIIKMNTMGVPVTIKRINGERMEECPFVNKRMQFEQEFKERMEKMAKDLNKLISDATEILKDNKTPIKVADRQKILANISMLVQEVQSNIPFVANNFNEQMESIVLEAKSEVDSFIQSKIETLGLAELQKYKMLNES